MDGRGKTVAVVGAGIAGPVLGMWLRRLGYAVIALESREAVEPDTGAFLGVAPNGMHALSGLDLAERIAGIGHPCHGFWFVNAAGRRIGAIDRSRDGAELGWPLTMVRRGELHALLASAAVDRGVELRLRARVVAVRDEPGAPVRIALDGGESLEVDALFGCDGVRSTVRDLVLPGAPRPKPSGLLDFGGFSGAPIPFPPGINVMVFGRRSFFGAFATGEGETWWFHNGPAAELADPRTHLSSMHAGDPPWIREVIEGTATILGPWSLRQLPSLPTWSAGRVCLLGDAAHAMSPSAGQGASMAMEDAIAVARSLREAPDLESAFARYEAGRRRRVESIARAAERNDGGKTGAGPIAGWFRDRMLSLFLPKAGEAQTKSYAHREPLP